MAEYEALRQLAPSPMIDGDGGDSVLVATNNMAVCALHCCQIGRAIEVGGRRVSGRGEGQQVGGAASRGGRSR